MVQSSVKKIDTRFSAKDREVISGSSLFRGVDKKALTSILQQCAERRLSAGDVLLSPEAKNDSLFIILTGGLTVHLSQISGQPLTYFGAGECVGELSVFDQYNPSAWVLASEDSRLLVISRDQLKSMIDHTEGIARNLVNILVDRLRLGNVAISDLETHANIDALTGLHNRRWLDKTFSRALHRATIDKTPLCLGMIDVDDFKKYNDNYGHQAGDFVLQKISLAMQELIRPFDLLARYGGEEFTILLPDTSLQEAIPVFERIRSGIADMPTVRDGVLAYQTVTVSIGVAQHSEDELPEMLLARADRALYQAKREGKDRVVVEMPEDKGPPICRPM